MHFTIRQYRPDDLPRIQEITLEGFDGVSIDRNIERDFGPVAGKDWRERKAREIAVDCELQPDGIFVAESEGRIVGYVTTRLDRFSGIGRIANLAVDAGCRQMGIGSTLIRYAVEWMRSQGMALAKIETLAQNERGQALYPQLGFREVARQIHYAMRLDDITTD
jgi:ribosomal protein S18 acetylase RimI-like enzyme